MCNAKITPIILMNTDKMENTFPLKDMLAKIPRINKGNKGTITFSMTCIMIFWKSLTTNFNVEFFLIRKP